MAADYDMAMNLLRREYTSPEAVLELKRAMDQFHWKNHVPHDFTGALAILLIGAGYNYERSPTFKVATDEIFKRFIDLYIAIAALQPEDPVAVFEAVIGNVAFRPKFEHEPRYPRYPDEPA